MCATSPDTLALYTYKSIDSRWGKRNVRIDIPRDVFSTFQLDPGTMLLLGQMSRKGRHWPRAVDVGCGYGTIGLYLGANGLADDITGIDRDLLAVTYAQKNAVQLGLTNVTFRPGLAYDALDGQTFDLIVSNIPAKAGEALHRLILLGASNYLLPGGEVWIVAVQPLEDEIDSILSDPAVEIAHKHIAKGYVVYNYSFRAATNLPADAYDRGTRRFAWRGHAYALKAFWGLAEFDTRSIETELVLDAVAGLGGERSNVREILLYNPGHGHLPILATRLMPSIELMRLRSRDVLALRACEHNLGMAGYKGRLAQDLSIDFGWPVENRDESLVVAVLEHGLGPALNHEMIQQWIRDGLRGSIIIACHVAMANQLMQRLKRSNTRLRRKMNSKGFCVFMI
jgi:SAM-dependent methyltransferase